MTRAETASRRAAVLAALLFSVSAQSVLAGVTIADVNGVARVRRPNTVSWNQVPANYVLNAGDEVKTDRSSRVTLRFDDGSRVELGPNSSYLLEDDKKESSSMTLTFGKLRAWVTKVSSRRFAVRTPTAVCSVRGTEFGVDVGQDGRTSVQLFEGLLGVQDSRGNEVLLNPGDSVSVDQRGINKEGDGAKTQETKSDERGAIKREVGLEMTKEQILAAAAEEIKQALYQQGKVMTDVNGNRVRIEEYILRPTPSSFKFVVLNERPDRFDYFFRTGQFNTTLPDDLSTALRQVPGCIGAPCTWFLTGYETAWSNTQDVVLETASGGHQVDVNNNGAGETSDNVTRAFDPAINDFVNLAAGTPFFTTLFNVYTLKFNGVQHTGWTNAVDITAMSQRTFTGTNLNIISSPNCTELDKCTGNREPGLFHDIIYRQNALGTVWDKFDNYIIDDSGEIAKHSDFAGITSGADYKKRLLDFNYQQIITASEFNGRKIDLVFEPKILMQSGLIP